MGFSSNISIKGWPLNIESKRVVPDLGNPTKKTGENSSVLICKFIFFHFKIFLGTKYFKLLSISFKIFSLSYFLLVFLLESYLLTFVKYLKDFLVSLIWS